MQSRELTSIVLPVYNQANHIDDVVKQYEAILPHIFHETILVVNGGEDKSLDVCRALEAQYGTVRTTYCQQNGWGRALKLGLRVAKGDVLCYTIPIRHAPSPPI